ncbi:MAG: hypothetical protein D6780_07475 [Candidatus Dadabacteria bacterium]|nr:MAG: hypothetical protein D6780_07475 [Candidatus Dadabacteria bacterium]
MKAKVLKRKNRLRGGTVLELMVTVLLSSLLLTALYALFFNSTKESLDGEIKIQTEETARAILDMLSFDLRMIGSGMPLTQANFQAGDGDLGTAPYPIFTDTTATYLHFRASEAGESSMLTNDFDTTLGTSTFNVVTGDLFKPGDIIYLANYTVGGSDGLYGVVENVADNSITLEDDYVSSPNAVFETGTVITKVSEIIYNSPDDDSGITRDDGNGEVTLAPNSTFEVEFRDSSGNPIDLPLSASEIINEVASVYITVTVNSQRKLSTGETFQAVAEQLVAIRNLMTIGNN